MARPIRAFRYFSLNRSGVPVPSSVAGVTILGSGWGPHYNMEGNMFTGFGFFDFEGDLGGMSSL